MKQTFVITIPATKGKRSMMESIENQTFLKSVYYNTLSIRNMVAKQIKVDAGHVSVYTLPEFTEICNDDGINIETTWFGFIHLIDDSQSGILKSAQNAIGNTLEYLNQTNKDSNRPNSLMYGMIDQANECTTALMKLNNYLMAKTPED